MARRRRSSWIVSGVVVVLTLALCAYVYVPRPIRLAEERSGDAALLAAVGEPPGHRRLAVVAIDADGTVRQAGIGAGPDDPFEVGSVTKALTGLALADAARRGEVRLDAPVSTYLPELAGSRAGEATLAELATHHAGYPRLGGRTALVGLSTVFTAGNPYGADRAEVLAEARAVEPKDRGAYAYSNLGAAVVGQAVAAAAGMSYADLMRTRVFEPLGMTSTAVADRPMTPEGLTTKGRSSAAWVMGGYAPAGGVVSTSADLTRLAQALVAATAPGQAALTPIAEDVERPGRQIGLFWQISPVGPDDARRTVTWHNGATGGYASFLGVDRATRRAVIVLSDTATSVDDLGIRLFTSR